MAAITLTASIFTALGLAIPLFGVARSNFIDKDDTVLVQAILDGDPGAYRGLVERYQGRIYNIVYGMVRNQEDAEDLAQDAFVKAFRKIDTFRLESKFYTWLCRIAVNTALDHLRKMSRRPTSEFDESIGTKDAEGNFIDQHNIDNPEANSVNEQLRLRLIAEVEKLPEDQKQVIVLREVDGLSYREISEIMDVPEGTIMSRLYYARKRLQDALKDLQESA
jgi:RNA polymerase sigma-70 factor, ECF subfamily